MRRFSGTQSAAYVNSTVKSDRDGEAMQHRERSRSAGRSRVHRRGRASSGDHVERVSAQDHATPSTRVHHVAESFGRAAIAANEVTGRTAARSGLHAHRARLRNPGKWRKKSNAVPWNKFESDNEYERPGPTDGLGGWVDASCFFTRRRIW